MKRYVLTGLGAVALAGAAFSEPVLAADPDSDLKARLVDALPSVAQGMMLAQAPTEPSMNAPRVPASGSPPQTPPLDEAHAIALKNHPGIGAADHRALAANEVYRQARSGLLPQVNLYGSVVQAESANTRIMAGGLNNPSVFNRAAFGAGVSQLITDFGRTSNLAASSKLQASAESQNAQTTREQVLLEADRDYFGVLQAQALENVAKQTVDTRQLLLDRVSILASNKLKSDLDVSFARVGLEDARLLLQRAQNAFDSALASLSAVLGYSEQQRFELVEARPA